MKKDIYSIHSKKKDRNYIIDNSKKSYKEFLLEVEGGQSYLERCKNDPNLPIYLVGIIQKEIHQIEMVEYILLIY